MKITGLASALMLLAALAVPQRASADGFTGEKTLGVSVGYNTDCETAQIGVGFSYRFCKLLRLAPSMDYVFRHGQRDGLMINCNAQMPLPIVRGISFFPQVGANFTSWSWHKQDTEDRGDVTTRVSKFGLNLGAGFDFDLTRTVRLGLTGNYTLTSHHYNNGQILLHLAFKF